MPEEIQVLIETGRPKALKDTTASTTNTKPTYQSSVLVDEYYKKLLLDSEQPFTTQDTKHITAQVSKILAATKSDQLDLQAVDQILFEYALSPRNTTELLKTELQASNSQSLAGISRQFTIPSSPLSSKDNDSAYTEHASEKDTGQHPTLEYTTDSTQAVPKSPGFAELMHQGMQTTHWSAAPNWTHDKADVSFKPTNTSSTKEHRAPTDTSEIPHVNTTINTDTMSRSSSSWSNFFNFFSGWGFGSAASSNNDSANLSGFSTNNDQPDTPFALSSHERFIHSASRRLLNQEASFGFDRSINSTSVSELVSRHASGTLSSHDLSNPFSAATYRNRLDTLTGFPSPQQIMNNVHQPIFSEVSSPSFTGDADSGTSRRFGSFNATDALSRTSSIHASSFSNQSSGSNLSSLTSSSQRFTSHATQGLFNQTSSSIFDSHDSNSRGLRISPTGGVDTSTGEVSLGFSIR